MRGECIIAASKAAMSRLFSNRDRAYDLGVLPTELLARDAGAAVTDARMPADIEPAGTDSIAPAIPEYRELCAKFLDGTVAPARAPVPDDPLTRARNLKASAYFLDATLAGVCRIEPSDWIAAPSAEHTHAFVFLIEFGRESKRGDPGAGRDVVRPPEVEQAELLEVLHGRVGPGRAA